MSRLTQTFFVMSSLWLNVCANCTTLKTGGSGPALSPPEALSLTEFASGKPLSRVLSQGQGRGLNAEERRIVERHAMELVKEPQGYGPKGDR